MSSREPEKFRTLYLDPGEDFGWCIGRDTKLLAAHTEKMWTVADGVWHALNNPNDPDSYINQAVLCREGVDPAENLGEIGRIVCEDWRLYPHTMKSLAWDQCRTARVIGAITFMCRLKGVPLVLQGANIKKSGLAAGAEELFYRPLHENRHQNDAIIHFSNFIAINLLDMPMQIIDTAPPLEDHDD